MSSGREKNIDAVRTLMGTNTRSLVDIRIGRLTSSGMRAALWLRGQERPRRIGTGTVIRSAAG